MNANTTRIIQNYPMTKEQMINKNHPAIFNYVFFRISNKKIENIL